jgi:hypothetical protein
MENVFELLSIKSEIADIVDAHELQIVCYFGASFCVCLNILANQHTDSK